MNMFWDFSMTPTPAPLAEVMPSTPIAKTMMAVVQETEQQPQEQNDDDIAEPSRDEVIDSSRGEGESREEERDNQSSRGDLSMFSTLTELLFNPFSDGYCKTPFCSDNDDYLPPSCPSGGFYTTPAQLGMQQPQQQQQQQQLPQDYTCDEYGDICQSNSAASSGKSSTQAKRRRQRPLAFAVGHGDEWKDPEGRRVVITQRRQHHRHHTRQNNARLSSAHHHFYSKASTTACTCKHPASNNSLMVSEKKKKNTSSGNPNDSPHKTKAVICKSCSSFKGLEAPSSLSSGSHTLL